MSRICALVAVLAIVVVPSRAPWAEAGNPTPVQGSAAAIPVQQAQRMQQAPQAQQAPRAQQNERVAPGQPDASREPDAQARQGQPDASSEPDEQAKRIEEMERELEQLRAQVTALQSQAEQTEQLVSEASRINEQIGGLREQLATAQAQAIQRTAEVDQAIATMLQVQEELLYGDSPDMDGRLAGAEAALESPAREHVQKARWALQNKDGANARWYLYEAIWSAQRRTERSIPKGQR